MISIVQRLLQKQILLNLFGRISRHYGSPGRSKASLLSFALLVRVAITLCMAFSCSMFSLILPWVPPPGDDVVQFDTRTSSLAQLDTSEKQLLYKEDPANTDFALPGTFCDCGTSCTWQDDNNKANSTKPPTCRNVLQCSIYPFLLQALTRWDAARFLRLALRPQLRTPQMKEEEEDWFRESEMAHAFFPLFPLAIQKMTQLLRVVVPSWLLPATCEELLVLSGWLVNTICFLVAMSSLYQCTWEQVQSQGYSLPIAQQWATNTVLWFVWNPAQVFFVTCYSESLFAALVFTGVYLVQRAMRTANKRQQVFSIQSTIYFSLGVLCWMLATYSRSNGLLYAGVLLLQGVGGLLQPYLSPRQWLARFLCCALAITAVVYPIWKHNQIGIDLHCSLSTKRPHWCNAISEGNGVSSFHLYPYIQRKYWNVGFLRYFEWKQLPNFILAAPILALSATATWAWIQTSLSRHETSTRATNIVQLSQCFVHWTVQALKTSVSDTPVSTRVDNSPCFLAPDWLPHYAVLAAAALVTLTTAHVQISTRLLCSSCPALYWYLASLLPTSQTEAAKYKPLHHAEIVLWYFSLYIVLGIVMHPNWLPWT